ncbi:hypothetical protein GCM10022295_13820 [Streptomyces osmaniensis]|uniref:4Fe-4S Mo/W bis-MGD-type domain-containing protein n=1 Tax=Streptomyces osmaniensis TaxID=593134 RepID=A0ABP6VE17_9ACTN
MVVVLDEEESHPVLPQFTGRTIRIDTHCVRTRACTMRVTLMDEDAVKRVPVARGFRYPAGTRPGRKCYDMCPIAIGS